MLLALTFVLCGISVQAQDELLVFEHIERAVTTLKSEYALHYRFAEKPFCIYIWELKAKSEPKSFLTVIITAHESSEWARMELECGPENYCGRSGSSTRVLDEKVIGLGDDNYMWETIDGKENGLTFIKGRYHIQIFANSLGDAKEVGWCLVGLCPDA